MAPVPRPCLYKDRCCPPPPRSQRPFWKRHATLLGTAWGTETVPSTRTALGFHLPKAGARLLGGPPADPAWAAFVPSFSRAQPAYC